MAGYGTKFEPEAFGDDVLFEARKRRLQRGLSLEGDDGLDSFSRKTYRRLEAGDDDALLDEAVRARRSRELGAMGLGETLPEAIPATPDAREKAHAILGEASQVQGGGGVAPDEGLAEWHARFKMRQAMADKAREEDFWERANAARARWARENRSFYQRKADAREERLQAELNRDMLAMRERAFDRALKEREAQRRSLAEMAQAQAARELEREKHERAMELERLRGEQALGLEGLRGENAYRQAMGVEGLRGENAQALEMHKGENAVKVTAVKAAGDEKVAQINGQAKMGAAGLNAQGMMGASAQKALKENAEQIEKWRDKRTKYLQRAERAANGRLDEQDERDIDDDDTLSPEQKREAKRLLREANGKSPELALFFAREAARYAELSGEPLQAYVLDGILKDGYRLVYGEPTQGTTTAPTPAPATGELRNLDEEEEEELLKPLVTPGADGRALEDEEGYTPEERKWIDDPNISDEERRKRMNFLDRRRLTGIDHHAPLPNEAADYERWINNQWGI